MTIVDCSAEMHKYHKERVVLPSADQSIMRTRRNAGRTRLENGLQRDGHPLPKEISSQGSYAMRTMVQDDECDYDIDDGVYFNNELLHDGEGNMLSPYDARKRICAALMQDDRLKHPAEIHNNCVRQPYPEGYHIDVPVYRIIASKDINGDVIKEYELASGDKWKKSDARAVTRWFNGLVGELNAGEVDGNQLRRITRLTKKFARSRHEWKEKTITGISITKLIEECFIPVVDRDDRSLYETWKLISIRLDGSYLIEHPVIAGENLANEDDERVGFFKEHLDETLENLMILSQSCTNKVALSAWDRAFNTSFFSEQYHEEYTERKSANMSSNSLLRGPVVSMGFTFPNKPIIPNKPAGFA